MGESPVQRWITALASDSGITMFLLFGVGPAIFYLGRQYLKLRRELNALQHSRSQQKRDAVVDAWDKIQQLESRNIPKKDMARAKRRILDTLEGDNIDAVEKSDISKEDANEVGRGSGKIEESRVTAFLAGMMAFGFFGVWGLAWGGGGVFLSIPFIREIWSWVEDSLTTGSHFGTLLKSGVLALAILASIGLWVLPAIAALLLAVEGLLKMVVAIRPNPVTQWCMSKLAVLKGLLRIGT